MKRIFSALLTLIVMLSAITILPATAVDVGASIAKKTASVGCEEGRFEVEIQVPGSDVYNDVVVTEYMSKWVNLDTATIKLIENNSATTIWNNIDGWLISKNRPTAQEEPIVVEKLSSDKYTEGGSRVIGNESGIIYKLTWYVKDVAMAGNYNYSLVYEIAIDTQETGFKYNTNYPVSGNTTIAYKEKQCEKMTKVIEDILIPEVSFVKEETPSTTESTEPIQTSPQPTEATKQTEPTEVTEETKATETVETTQPETIDIKGRKIWQDQNDKYGKRPKCITVNLISNGIEVDYKIVTAEDNWKYTFKDVAKYDEEGKKITYTISEDEVANYETKIKGYNITNIYVKPEEPSTEAATEPTTQQTTEPTTESATETTKPEIKDLDEKPTEAKSSKAGTYICIVLAIVLVVLLIILIIKKVISYSI